MVSVIVRLLYRITPEDISVIIETQLRIAPDIIPLDIIGTVILIKLFALDAPRLIAASSILVGIFIIAAVADLLVKGILRIESAMIMMSSEPVSTKGLLLNVMINDIPITPPGIIYGIMEITSIALLNALLLLTTR